MIPWRSIILGYTGLSSNFNHRRLLIWLSFFRLGKGRCHGHQF